MVAYLQRRHYAPYGPARCARAIPATSSIRSRRSAAIAARSRPEPRAARRGVPRLLRRRRTRRRRMKRDRSRRSSKRARHSSTFTERSGARRSVRRAPRSSHPGGTRCRPRTPRRSGWRSSVACTMPRCTPRPRPCTSRTSASPAAAAAVTYSSTTDAMSRGAKGVQVELAPRSGSESDRQASR